MISSPATVIPRSLPPTSASRCSFQFAEASTVAVPEHFHHRKSDRRIAHQTAPSGRLRPLPRASQPPLYQLRLWRRPASLGPPPLPLHSPLPRLRPSTFCG